MYSLSAGININPNGCLKCRSTNEPVPNAATTNSKEHGAAKELLQQINAAPSI